MTPFRFEIIKNKKEAMAIWEKFSLHKVIDDEWDFRFAWVEELNLPFKFIVAYDGEETVGFLPLQLNTLKGLGPKLLGVDKPFLEVFGGVDTDDNMVWTKLDYKYLIPDFFKQVKDPVYVTSLKEEYSFEGVRAEFYLDRFELDLTKFQNYEDFLAKHFDGISRQRLKNRINRLERAHDIVVKHGEEKDLQILFDLSIKRFGEKSSFKLIQRQNAYRQLMKLFDADFFIVEVDGKNAAASFCLIYKGSYISLNVGYDLEVRDLSKFLVVTQVQRAFEKGLLKYDAGQGDNGWKEHFGLTKIPQYKLILNF